MTKITQLPLAEGLDGTETVVMVKDNITRRAALGGLVGAAVAPHVSAAELARDQAASLVKPENRFVAATLETAVTMGEGHTANGTYFIAVGEAEGEAEVRLRTADGSSHIYTEVTKAALTSVAPGKGAALVGFLAGGAGAVQNTLQDKARERVSIRDYLPAAGGDIALAAHLGLTYLNTLGGGVLDFVGIEGECSTITLNGLSNIILEGSGARLTRTADDNNCTIFHIHGGCNTIEVRGFADLDGGHDGSNQLMVDNKPVILIGNISTGDGGYTNQNIRIHGNVIRRSMWGGVVIYGRSGNGGAPTPLNRNIHVTGNTFTQCSNGVFVYKNARGVRIANNFIQASGYDGIICDTHAAGDTVTTEPISDVKIEGNTIDGFGLYGFGVGILLKGAVSQTTVAFNSIQNAGINAGGSFANYGINLSNDTGTVPAGVSDVAIEGNDISNIRSSQTKSGYGINIGGLHNAIIVRGNKVSRTTNHGLLIGTRVRSIIASGNTFRDCGDGIYSVRAEGATGVEIYDLILRDNIVIKGSTYAATGGFYVNWAINALIEGNVAQDFTSTAQVTANIANGYAPVNVSGAAIPTSGYHPTGKRLRNTAPTTASPVVEWVCIGAGLPGLWRPASWITGRAPTANRPTLTANDIGVMYMDTTLAAGGKPIWWNGTNWIDATGAVA